MAKKKPSSNQTPPSDFPQSPPRDLHPTSDIRFVIAEVSKLSAHVERLIEDVKSQNTKLDRHGTIIAWATGGITVGGIIIGFILDKVCDKLSALITLGIHH